MGDKPVRVVDRDISYAHRDALDASGVFHHVRPLPVYDVDRSFIPIGKVKSKMVGALVEVHFRIRHFYLRSQLIDSFTGSIDNVFLLQPAVAKRKKATISNQSKRSRVVKNGGPSRSEQVFAANAFMPIPSKHPLFWP